MTTLITGATGRIGSRFVPRLLCEGERVRVLARDPAKTEPLERRGAEVVLGDLRDSDVLERSVGGVDAVVHLAAAFRGVSEEETVAINHAATIELADAALRAQVETFVLTSTNSYTGLVGGARPARTTSRHLARPIQRASSKSKRPFGGCTAIMASGCGSCDSRLSMAKTTRTSANPRAGPAIGHPISVCTWCITPTSDKR